MQGREGKGRLRHGERKGRERGEEKERGRVCERKKGEGRVTEGKGRGGESVREGGQGREGETCKAKFIHWS